MLKGEDGLAEVPAGLLLIGWPEHSDSLHRKSVDCIQGLIVERQNNSKKRYRSNGFPPCGSRVMMQSGSADDVGF